MVALTKIKTLLSRRVGAYLVLSIILANAILSPLVSAAGAVDSMTLDKQVNAYTYYYAWAKCMDNTDKWDGGSTSISVDNAVSGKWFSTATSLGEEDGHVGYIASPSNGILDCNGTDIVNNALNIWGFGSDKTAVLTDQGATGFHFTKKGDNYEPSANYRSAFLSAIRNKAFGGQTPMLSGPAKYYFYSQSFIAQCQPSFITTPSADIKAAADSGSSNKYGMLKSYDPATKTMADKYFELKADPKMDTFIGNLVEGTSEVANVLGGAYADGKAECRTLANDANSNAASFQRYAQQHPDLIPADIKSGEGAASGNSDGGASTCVIEGVGWIVCPVVRTIASMVDKVYALLQLMLATPPLPMEPDASSNPLYGAWSGMRNIANVIFVIAFIVIIYSQVTSAGISNYGIKKLLPKLIVSAILINISFWLCALAVDLSNVLGASIYSFLSSVGGGGGNSNWAAIIEVLLGGAAAGVLTYGAITIAASALGAAGVASALLWLAIPLIITISIAILIGATVLALRQALVIILVFASPLAFAAYLLPNTQGWFDKWRKLFTTMLVFYPLFSLLFGGASIASRVLVSSSSKAGAGTAGILLLTGMAVQFLPLFLVPFLIKTSSGLLGKVAGRMQGSLGGATGSLTKMARSRNAENIALAKGRLLTGSRKGTGRLGRRTFGAASGVMQKFDNDSRARKLEGDMLGATREADWQQKVWQDSNLQDMHVAEQVSQARAGSARRMQNAHYYDTLDPGTGVISQEVITAAGVDPKGQERVLASVIAQKQKENREAVENSKALLHNGDASGTIGRAVQQLEQANTSGDTIAARAAAQVLRESGTPGRSQLHEAINRLQASPSGLNNDIAENIKADGLAAGVKAYDSSMDQWNASPSGAKLSDFVSDPKSAARLNQVELAGQLKEQLKTWQASGLLTRDQARAVLDAHEKGTIPLDLEKKAIFELAAK